MKTAEYEQCGHIELGIGRTVHGYFVSYNEIGGILYSHMTAFGDNRAQFGPVEFSVISAWAQSENVQGTFKEHAGNMQGHAPFSAYAAGV
jgi:hypothetical protein